MTAPLVSVIMPCFQAEAYVGDAIRSVLEQTLADLELIVIDDASRDGSWAHIEALARRDARIRAKRLAANAGPAAARNAALDRARGRWIALIDADDLYHPDRLRRLVMQAEGQEADLIADNLLSFGAGRDGEPFLSGGFTRPRWIGLPDYLGATGRWRSRGDLGYLKPVFRATALDRHKLRYDTRLHVGEDDDLIVRLLLAGARYRLLPVPTYFYRRHGASISSRPALPHLRAMVAGSARHLADAGSADAATRAALRTRLTARRRALHWEELAAALKAGEAGRALRAAAARPSPLTMAWRPLAARLRRRRTGAPAPAAAPEPAIRFAAPADGPTALALDWFLAEIWPQVRAARPRARLTIAGTAARLLGHPAPAGVRAGAADGPAAIEIAPYRVAPLPAPPAAWSARERIATPAARALAAPPETRVTFAADADGFAAALVAALGRAEAAHG